MDLLLLLFSAALAGAPAPAPLMAGCVAARRDEPTLDATRLPTATFRTEIQPIGSQGTDELYLLTGVETATLPSGAKLTVNLSGCESYANSYVFEIDDRTSLKDGRHWFETAARLIAEVKAVSADPPVRFDELERDLLADAERRADYDFQAGEFVAHEYSELLRYNYGVSVARTKAGTTLTVDYWVPL